MKKSQILNKVKEYIYLNFNEQKKELYEYIYDNLQSISKWVDIDEDYLEEILVDRNSIYYNKLANKIINEKRRDITIIEKIPLYYIVKISDINIQEKKQYFNKIEYILNNSIDNSKGFIYQDFSLLFLQEVGFNIIEQKKTDDGGLDIIGDREYMLSPIIPTKIHIYGQVKFYNKQVTLNQVKQFVKDKLYRVIIEKGSVTECQQGIFISHNGFSNTAIKYAKQNNIILLDTYDIITMLMGGSTMSKSLAFINEEYLKVVNKSIKYTYK